MATEYKPTKQRDMNSEIAKAIARYQQRLAEQAEIEALQRPVVSNQPTPMSPEQQAQLAELQEQERLRNYEPPAWNPNAQQTSAPQVEYPPQVNADNGMVQAPPREAPAPIPQGYNPADKYIERLAQQNQTAQPSVAGNTDWGAIGDWLQELARRKKHSSK